MSIVICPILSTWKILLDGQTEKNGRKQMERERQRGAQALMQSKQENQRGWVQHMLRQKEHMALARAGEAAWTRAGEE